MKSGSIDEGVKQYYQSRQLPAALLDELMAAQGNGDAGDEQPSASVARPSQHPKIFAWVAKGPNCPRMSISTSISASARS